MKEGEVDKATSPSGHGPAVSRGLKGFTEGKQLFDFPELTLKCTAMSRTPSVVRLQPDNLFQHFFDNIKMYEMSLCNELEFTFLKKRTAGQHVC